MADGFRLVPIKAEMAAGDRQIRRYSQFFAAARSYEGTVVADAQAKATSCGPDCTLPNLGKQGEFA